jgi:chemotaxis protein histidine kinase CheA
LSDGDVITFGGAKSTKCGFTPHEKAIKSIYTYRFVDLDGRLADAPDAHSLEECRRKRSRLEEEEEEARQAKRQCEEEELEAKRQREKEQWAEERAKWEEQERERQQQAERARQEQEELLEREKRRLEAEAAALEERNRLEQGALAKAQLELEEQKKQWAEQQRLERRAKEEEERERKEREARELKEKEEESERRMKAEAEAKARAAATIVIGDSDSDDERAQAGQKYWQEIDHGCVKHLFPVLPGSDEYKEVQKILEQDAAAIRSRRNPWGFAAFVQCYELLHLERIQNPTLHACYMALKTSKIKARQDPKEIYAVHGSAKETLDNICSGGFNRSYNGKNATMYGKGAYFAKAGNYTYAAQQQYAKPHTDGTQRLILTRVLEGERTIGYFAL